MIKVLKNADIYSPQPLGLKDVLIIGDKICRISDSIDEYDEIKDAEIYDLKGQKLIPGYIDLHVHITGGGGEQGPASRVPESQLSIFTRNGITTVIGLLGTDGITRSLENLIAKARALTEEGITAYALTGSYGYPPKTLTGSVERDITLVTPIIGVKTSVSDHRSSNPTGESLINLVTSARRGGLISGNPGLLTMHMGSGKEGLNPVLYAIEHCDVPLKHFLPTHMLRTHELMEQGAGLVRMGGYIDCTAGSDDTEVISNAKKLLELLSWDGISTGHVTLSSDAFGSQPKFNEDGECTGLTYSSPKYIHKTIQILIKHGIALEKALRLITSTPAELIGKSGIKGCISEGADADLIVLDDNLDIDSVFAMGKTAVLKKEIIMKGQFE